MRNSQTNCEDFPDPPIVYYRSLGLVGGDLCDSTSKRNKMSMIELWQTSCDPSTRDFRNEMSSRNPFLKMYADLGLSHICAILDSNNLARVSRNITSIIEQDNESKDFHTVLTNFARKICVSFSEKYGPSGTKYINNDFLVVVDMPPGHLPPPFLWHLPPPIFVYLPPRQLPPLKFYFNFSFV